MDDYTSVSYSWWRKSTRDPNAPRKRAEVPLEINLDSDVYQRVHQWLVRPLHGDDISIDTAHEYYGAFGYLTFIDEAYTLRNALVGSAINKISIDKGLLRISASTANPTHHEIWQKFSQQLARRSAGQCIYCGAPRGRRRREEVGWPNLCSPHYIEYVNQLEESTRQVGEGHNPVQPEQDVSESAIEHA